MLTLVTAPEDEPITLTEAKTQVQRQHVTDDDRYLLDTLIPAVRERAEQATARQFITATWELTFDWFPTEIIVPRAPLRTIVSITYANESGTTTTLAANQYTVQAPNGPRASRGRVIPAYGVTWPTARSQADAVTVRFTAGYGDADDVPPRLKMGMLLDLGTLYENREDQIVGQGYTVSPLPNGSASIYKAFKSY